MNYFGSCLLISRSYYLRRTASAFLFYLAGTVIACLAGYLYYLAFGAGGSYAIVTCVNSIADFTNSQTLNVIEAFVLFVAVYTVCFKCIGAILIAVRGACLGVSAYLFMNNCLVGISDEFVWSLIAYFMSTVAFIVLVSISSVYSEVICATHVSRNRMNMRSLVVEYSKLFLTISGIVFTLGCITVALI